MVTSLSPPPKEPARVAVPPLFDFPPLFIVRGLESPYNMFFGKMVLRSLFDDYFEEANNFSTMIMLTRSDDRYHDFIAKFHGPLHHKTEEGIVGNVQFSVKRDYEVIQLCHDIHVSVSGRTCLLKSSAYLPNSGFGGTLFLPILSKSRLCLGDNAVMGFRCDPSSNMSVGATFDPSVGEYPSTAWLVSKLGRVTTGVQYEPKFGSKGEAPYENLANWSGAIGYSSGSSPLTPSFHFGFELANNSQFIASLYKHMVVTTQVDNPLIHKGIVCGWIRNYIDFGFELQTRVDGDKLSNKIKDFTFQIAASWQLSENLLVKGKLGPLSSSIALAFKSWWQPSFTINVSAVRDRTKGETSFGFGILVDNIRSPRYQRTLQKGAFY